jgi:hypothetical protein
MNLLKVGTLNIPASRWSDANIIFEKIYHLSIDEKYISEKQGFIPIINDKFRNIIKILIKIDLLIIKINGRGIKLRKYLIEIYKLLLKFMIDSAWIESIDIIHISYNDFDDSSFLHLLFLDKIKNFETVRAYKESRPAFDSLEYNSLKESNTIVVTSNEAKLFFIDKYIDLKYKKFIIGIDEDWRSIKIANLCNNLQIEKMSMKDGVSHFVILAGQVYSDLSNLRSGARLYYIPLIKKILEKGFHVHIHTKKIISDISGIDQYSLLESRYPNLLHIEKALNFEEDPNGAYSVLSGYDFGILHANVDGSSTSKFDETNIPHRIYEYLYSGVLPITQNFQKKIIESTFPDLPIINLENLLSLNKPHVNYFIKPKIEHVFINYLKKIYFNK